MVEILILTLSVVLGVAVGQPTSTCQDLDTDACVLFAKAMPNLCQDPKFSMSTCQRYCGNCPLECYSCPTPVFGPNDCNTTTTCGAQQTCMTKHLTALDGHDEWIMSCESKSLCEGNSFGFGALIGKRDVSLTCCDTDFCNVAMTTTTLPPTSPGPFPHGCNRDIVFLLDDSGSVGVRNFQHSVDFTRAIIDQLDIAPDKALTSVVPFSSRVLIKWYLNTYDNKQDTLNALSSVRYVGGTTHTNDAMEAARTNILTQGHGDRPNAENVVIVLSDGRSTNKIDTIREANRLHQVSKDVISIVVGSGIDLNELNAIATDSHHVFDVTSYSTLNSILPQLMQIICNA